MRAVSPTQCNTKYFRHFLVHRIKRPEKEEEEDDETTTITVKTIDKRTELNRTCHTQWHTMCGKCSSHA